LNKEKKKFRIGILWRLLTYIFKSWPLFILAVVMTLLSNQLALLGPKYSGAAIDAIELEGGVDFSAVWKNVGLIAIAIVLAVVTVFVLNLNR
jgi:ATP-binding cassette subfamily B protein